VKLSRVPVGSIGGEAEKQAHSGKRFVKLAGVLAGSVLAAVGLELFLLPHRIVVGGATGLSALFALFTGMRLGLFLFFINLAFILLAYRHIRKEFAFSTVLALFMFSICTLLLHPVPAVVADPVLAAICGGIALGLGIGIVVRSGGSLDATEHAVDDYRSWKALSISASNKLLFVNCLILAASGFVIGWTQALYSAFAYLLAFEMVNLTIKGFAMQRTVSIYCKQPDEIAALLQARLNVRANRIDQDRDAPRASAILHCFIHRMDAARLKAIVRNADDDAVIIMTRIPRE